MCFYVNSYVILNGNVFLRVKYDVIGVCKNMCLEGLKRQFALQGLKRQFVLEGLKWELLCDDIMKCNKWYIFKCVFV